MRLLMAATLVLGGSFIAGCHGGDRGEASSASSAAPTAPVALKAGDAAKPFQLKGSDGKMHSLADDAGKRAVVLAWFPKAFTGG